MVFVALEKLYAAALTLVAPPYLYFTINAVIFLIALSSVLHYDGPHSPAKAITVDDDLAMLTGTEEDAAAPDERTERPRRPAKPTTKFSDFVYY